MFLEQVMLIPKALYLVAPFHLQQTDGRAGRLLRPILMWRRCWRDALWCWGLESDILGCLLSCRFDIDERSHATKDTKIRNVEDLLESRVVKAFFPRGLSHHMGPDVHDAGAKPKLSFCEDEERSIAKYSEKGLLRPANEVVASCMSGASLLKPGMVITVEPEILMSEHMTE